MARWCLRWKLLGMYLSEAHITDLANLRDRIWGEVLLPSDPSWDEARSAFNLTVDQQPAAIVLAESAEDVQAAVRFARKHQLRVAPQTTGHNAGPLEPNLASTLLVKTQRMKGVAIDVDERIARVQAGTVWSEVVEKLEGTGLAALHGSSGTVGVVGYSLTGGLGFQGRKHGLQVNQITAIELVNEFGDTMRATADEQPDLFWALRGGGGNFGVVTAIEFRLVPTPELHAGMMLWPWERAQQVFETWLTMLPDLPEELTTTCRLIQFPPFEELPPFLRGRQLVVLDGAFLGDRQAAEQALAPLRALSPELDTWTDVPPAALADLHMDPEDPGAIISDQMLIEDHLDPSVAQQIAAIAGPESDSPVAVFELRHTGGALARCRPGSGARDTIPGRMLYFSVAPLVPGGPTADAIGAQNAKVRELLSPHAADQGYLNFAEQPGRLADFYDPHTFARLAAVKQEHDTANIFQGNFEL